MWFHMFFFSYWKFEQELNFLSKKKIFITHLCCKSNMNVGLKVIRSWWIIIIQDEKKSKNRLNDDNNNKCDV
jgi:hypothetical protein